VIVEGDVMRVRKEMTINDVMTKTPFCCKQSDTALHAAELMKAHDVGSIPVVNNCEEKKLLGIVTDRDICLKIVGAGKASNSLVKDAMTKSVATSHVDDTLDSCEAKMQTHQVRRIPVVDSHGICVGIVSLADVALHDSAEHTSRTLAEISRHQPKKQLPKNVYVVGAV
jgi:CBS domain-containing protein